MWSVLLRVLDQLLDRLGKAHSIDATLDAQALDDCLLSSKIRRHFTPGWKRKGFKATNKGSTGMSLVGGKPWAETAKYLAKIPI